MTSAKVLIVDDNDFARELLVERLGEDGYDLITADSGERALALAAEERPDVILLDVMMPLLDGYEVCRRLRRDPKLREIPVLMITALDDAESKVKGIEAGADDFISKSYDPNELRARVRTVTRLDRYRRLHAERTKFEWVVEHSEDGYLMVAGDDTIVYANPAARGLLGREEHDGAIVGRSFLPIATGRYRCEPEDLWASWPDPPAQPLFLLRPESQHEGAFWLRVDRLTLPIAEGHKLVRLRDQTARMTLSRSLWKFSALVSTKLRTALTMTLGTLDMLAEDVERYSKDDVERIATLAARSGKRLQAQIQDVLGFLDEPEKAEGSDAVEVVRIEPLVRELASMLKLGQVHLESDGVAPAGRLPLSAVAFELVLREVLENAQRFHPEGTPEVRVRLAAEDAGPPSRRHVRLTLDHDGAPLPASELARAWIPYHHRPHDDGSEPTSVGFGFSMVGPLLWGVGGSCRLSNRPDGTGLTVELTLPLLPGP